MNLQQIDTFVRVVESGSFSKAAVLLDMAQPALSRQVRALETELRVALLIRTGRGVVPTDAGRRLLEHGHAIMQRVALAKEDLGAQRDEPVGSITVALPPSMARQLSLPRLRWRTTPGSFEPGARRAWAMPCSAATSASTGAQPSLLAAAGVPAEAPATGRITTTICPAETRSPAASGCRSVTTPEQGAETVVSIFIAVMISRVWPTDTVAPVWTRHSMTEPD